MSTVYDLDALEEHIRHLPPFEDAVLDPSLALRLIQAARRAEAASPAERQPEPRESIPIPPALREEGWVLVPREPTKEMDQAAKAAIDDYYDGDSLRYDEIGRIYRAMLSAVPPVQPEEGWRPIETAPRDGTEIDLWGYWPENDRWKRTADAWWDSAENCWRLDQYRHEGMYVHRPRFTHWQPLPVPPVLADGGGSSYASPSQPDAARHGSQADAEPSGKED